MKCCTHLSVCVCACYPNLTKHFSNTHTEHRCLLIALHITTFAQDHIALHTTYSLARPDIPRADSQAHLRTSTSHNTSHNTTQHNRNDNDNEMFAATILQFVVMIADHYFKMFLLRYMFEDDLRAINEDGGHELREQAGVELSRRLDTFECWDCQSYDLQPTIRLERECACCLHRAEETVYFECACGWSNDHAAHDRSWHEPISDPVPIWELTEADRMDREWEDRE